MTSTDYDVRPARRQDYLPAADLLTASKLPLQGFADHFGNALVATSAGRVVGVVELEIYGEAALLRSLVVAPSERGAHLGERLTEEALRLARERSAADVYLLTETAERFFPRFGFAVEERTAVPEALKQSEEFRTACPETAVMMHARLDAR
jgi:amino-acid N-acetyltransferase